MRAHSDAPIAWSLFALGAFVLLLLYSLDDLKAWLRPIARDLAAVQTFGLGNCEAPVEGERMLIFIGKRGGKVVLEGCAFVGSKGSYSRPAPKGPNA